MSQWIWTAIACVCISRGMFPVALAQSAESELSIAAPVQASALEHTAELAYRYFSQADAISPSIQTNLNEQLASLEASPDLRAALLAQRIRIGLLLHNWLQQHRWSVPLPLTPAAKLQPLAAESIQWVLPAPADEHQMRQLFYWHRLYRFRLNQQLKHPQPPSSGNVPLPAGIQFLFHTLWQALPPLRRTSAPNTHLCQRLLFFHLFLPFRDRVAAMQEELEELYGPQPASAAAAFREEVACILAASGSWLYVLQPRQLQPAQVRQLLLSRPFSPAGEVETLRLLIQAGDRLFPVYTRLLQQDANRKLLHRIIYVLARSPGDKAELLALVRARLFGLYFLYRGEFLTVEKLVREFAYMNLQEGENLLLLLLSDTDPRVRQQALARLAEIGNANTRQQLERMLYETELRTSKRMRRKAWQVVDQLHHRSQQQPAPARLPAQTDPLAIADMRIPLTLVEEMPLFPGGTQALRHYLRKRTRPIRKLPLRGTVMLRFVVNARGKVQQAEVLQGLHARYDQRALRILRRMPRWQPGRHNGRPVPVQLYLPVVFAGEKQNSF
ncbi:MAG: energy transducer TonB [Bacteroidetes bacterium]|nr:MAG: energy transducer TonB [Bacteroidota bacterium]